MPAAPIASSDSSAQSRRDPLERQVAPGEQDRERPGREHDPALEPSARGQRAVEHDVGAERHEQRDQDQRGHPQPVAGPGEAVVLDPAAQLAPAPRLASGAAAARRRRPRRTG